jgi:two-component system sensor histidine kinase/response regulator
VQEDTRVLIVEDDTLVSKMIERAVEEIGCVVTGRAANGLQAVEMTQSLQPDVVLMDIDLPDMDGVEASRHIQERCPTPVVVLTACETPELVEQASAAGVGVYLVKPPQAGEIDRAITIATARFDDMMELRRLSAELQARNEELDAFSHIESHDLKGPLTLVIGHASFLEETWPTMPAEEVQKHLQAIVRSGYKMINIVDELLLLSSVRKEEVESTSLDMSNIVNEARRRLAHMVEKHRAEIILPDGWPTALGHGPWVEEVWGNYLSNAMKYGGRPPRVELGATEQEDGTVRFWVRDNGAGLTPEEQAQLFTPFTQFAQGRAKGYGLGLSIVRRIIEKLGGQVGVESEVGRGSVFYFTLPGAGENLVQKD